MPFRFECPAPTGCDYVGEVLEDITTHYKAAHPDEPTPTYYPGGFTSHAATPLYMARCRACGVERESRSVLPPLCPACTENQGLDATPLAG